MSGSNNIDNDSHARPAQDPTQEADMTFLDLVIVVAKFKRVVIGLPVVVAVVATIALLLHPNIYTATARILPPQSGQAGAAAAFSALTGVAGGIGTSFAPALGLKDPNELYVGILKANAVSDRIIDRFKLKERFDKNTLVEARNALEAVVHIRAGRDGLIAIEVDDKDPAIAAAMANAFIEELHNLTQTLAVSDASKRRVFLEKELSSVRDKLAEAEGRLRSTQEKTGLIQPDAQGKAIFDAFSEVRARIAAKEVELASLRTFATNQNPAYLRAQEELASLKSQLARLEKSRPDQNVQGNILVPTTEVPGAGLEYVRRVREIKYQESLYELLSKQYELARIEESKDAVLIQVVDKALPPDRKSKPKRALILVVVTAMAAILAVVAAFFLEFIERARLRPADSQRLEALRRHLRW